MPQVVLKEAETMLAKLISMAAEGEEVIITKDNGSGFKRISTANELLLSLLLRGTWNESALRELPEADWNCLIRQARRHALEPLLYQQLKTRHQTIPAVVLRDLQAKYFACAWRNNSLYQELAKSLNA